MLYEVYEADEEDVAEAKEAMAEHYQQAYEAYWSEQYEEASLLFAECLRFDPEDSVVRMYMQRCLGGKGELIESSFP